MSNKITCQLCGEQVHAIRLHLKESHPDWTVERYREEYPDAPLLSPLAESRIVESRAADKRGARAEMATGAAAAVAEVREFPERPRRVPLHEQFKLGKVKAAMNKRGDPIMITVLPRSGEFVDMIPRIDERYVFNIEILKAVLMGLDLNIPVYLWGHAGTGKTTMFKQVCAYTNRPFYRVQHTANTEEAHVVGQMLANERGTYFEPGPLALAMRYGWVYVADEYDFAHPSVTAVYQPVLEGEPLIIKEATPEWRVIEPHPNFRFCATGNTNGSGDESGLYRGTEMGNAANYSRFGITEKMPYMPAKQEELILRNQAGLIPEDAKLLVEFASKVREGFDRGDVGMTIGPRELIYAAKIGLRRGSWLLGLRQAFINRLNEVDRQTVEGIAQRFFAE